MCPRRTESQIQPESAITEELNEVAFQPQVIRDAMAMVPSERNTLAVDSPFSRMLEASAEVPEAGAFSWQMVQKTAENALQMFEGRSEQELVEGFKMTESLISRLTGELGMAAEKANRKPDILLFLLKFKKALTDYLVAREGKRDLLRLEEVNKTLLDLRKELDDALHNKMKDNLLASDASYIELDLRENELLHKLTMVEEVLRYNSVSNGGRVKVGTVSNLASVSETPSTLIRPEEYLVDDPSAGLIRGWFMTYGELTGEDWKALIKRSQSRELTSPASIYFQINVNLSELGRKFLSLQEQLNYQLNDVRYKMEKKEDEKMSQLLNHE